MADTDLPFQAGVVQRQPRNIAVGDVLVEVHLNNPNAVTGIVELATVTAVSPSRIDYKFPVFFMGQPFFWPTLATRYLYPGWDYVNNPIEDGFYVLTDPSAVIDTANWTANVDKANDAYTAAKASGAWK
jgi:hypothetical protein